jgi:hypothetical protein
MKNWYIGRDRKKFGPFSTTQIRQLTVLGVVKPTEYVLEEGAAKWVPVTSVAGPLPAADGPKKYWLSLEAKNQGPYPADRIRVALMRRQIAGETLACVEGGKEWVPLARLDEFRACVPPSGRDPNARLGLGSSHLDLSPEEAELHLARKQGDMIARLISTLLDLKRRYRDNPSMVAIIEKNVQDLKAARSRGFSGVFSVQV